MGAAHVFPGVRVSSRSDFLRWGSHTWIFSFAYINVMGAFIRLLHARNWFDVAFARVRVRAVDVYLHVQRHVFT